MAVLMRIQPPGSDFAHHRTIALGAEAACFDAIFLADDQAVRVGPPQAIRRVAQYIGNCKM
jgi:hypothetical protein